MEFGYIISVVTTIGIFSFPALGLDVILGQIGDPWLAQASFFSVGAYSTALLTKGLGISFWESFPVSVLFALLLGVGIGSISLRVSKDFLAIATIGLNFVIQSVYAYVPFFGATAGITAIAWPSLFGSTVSAGEFALLIFAFLALVTAFLVYLKRTWLGLAWRAIKEDEVVARTNGIRSSRFRLISYAIGSACAGIGGIFYASYLQFVIPDNFGFSLSLLFLAAIVFGGLGSTAGALLGTTVLVSIPEIFRFISSYRLMIFGAILILSMLISPAGVIGASKSLYARLRRRNEHGNHLRS